MKKLILATVLGCSILTSVANATSLSSFIGMFNGTANECTERASRSFKKLHLDNEFQGVPGTGIYGEDKSGSFLGHVRCVQSPDPKKTLLFIVTVGIDKDITSELANILINEMTKVEVEG